MSIKNQIILVSTGSFQNYIKENINQLLRFQFDIHVIVDFPFLKELDEYKSNVELIDSATLQTNFDKKSKLDKKFRNGFWNNTSKRLFLLYEYIKIKKLKNVIHIENDVLLYSNMDYNFEEKIYITMDSNDRCIPGIIYIPKYDLFTNLIENYDFTKNDMINLSNFYLNNKDIVKTFPIIDNTIDKCIYNENFQEFNSIFDGAAIGQYLGGVDPRNIPGDTTGFVNETCEIKYDKYKFKWVEKRNDYFPYIEINNKLIPINNLHIHSKKLENFRTDNPVENEYIKLLIKHINFITGEKIQFSCDHFVGTDEDFRYNPNIAQYKNRFIYLGSNANINNKPLIFSYTCLLDNIDKLVRTLEGLQNPFILVLHNSDRSFNRKDLILFEKLPLLQYIYTQNMNIEHEKVFPLPIGLANSQWTHGNSKIHQQVFEMHVEKTKEIYFNFSKITNRKKRDRCYNDIIKKGITWNNFMPYKEYLIELKRHKYAICPDGNGLDTHRFWECLYMNTIPICLKNKTTTYYKQYFPIILLNDWQELDVSELPFIRIPPVDRQYLDMDYIIKQIKGLTLNKSENLNKLQKVETLVDSFFHKSHKYTLNETVAYYPDGTMVSGGESKPNTFYRHICYYTIKEALTHLIKQNKSKYTIVETGCAAHGTKSTLLWDKFVNTFGGKVISVDLNQEAVDETNAKTSSKTTVHCSDSLKLLPTLTEKIDFLYLDSYDVDFLNPKPSADHHLKEFYCIKELLNDGCIILIDDTPVSPEWLDGGKINNLYDKLNQQFDSAMAGKGSLVNHYLSQIGSEKIDHKYQALWKFKGIPKNLFDIVIPVGPNDKSVIEQQITYTKKNIIGYRNIYLICYDPSITVDGCITINENIFPFNIDTVAKYHGKLERNGWYLQQLLKLYAGKIIPDILDKYLVIDCDTFFLKPTAFLENNKCLYNYGTEYHKPYFYHMEKLDKDLTKIDKNKSGICHHMIFETKYIDELISGMEKNHNDLFYNIFLKTVTDKEGSGASEYEIYFNYMLKYNPDKIQIRKLNWKNTNKLETNSNFDYISYHWYMR